MAPRGRASTKTPAGRARAKRLSLLLLALFACVILVVFRDRETGRDGGSEDFSNGRHREEDNKQQQQSKEVRGHGMSRDRYKDSHITMAQKLLLQKPPKPFHPRCFDAPKPWRPLEEIEEWKRRRVSLRRKALSSGERANEVGAEGEGEEEHEGMNGTESRERGRRQLLMFKAAGMGGKFGPSCSPRAPLKARQACAEQRR